MLLERETLDSEEIEAAMEGRPLPARDRIIIPSWSDKRNQAKEKKRPASIFGTPKPATS
jgi:cell division protease FtsH